jgi:hypothetical protein
MTRIRVTRSITMKKIRLNRLPWNKETCRNAAMFGHLQLLKWLHEQGCPWDEDTFDAAVRYGGNVEMLEWLYKKNSLWMRGWHCSLGAISGNMDVLKWLHGRKFLWGIDTFDIAIEKGNLEMVNWLHEQKFRLKTHSSLYAAARSGDIAMVKWCLDHGCIMNKYASIAAAEKGNLEMLQWLHEQG